jgi:hypothetical protein
MLLFFPIASSFVVRCLLFRLKYPNKRCLPAQGTSFEGI